MSRLISKKKKKNFLCFSMGRNQYWAGRVYDLCVYYMTGTPEGSTESGFMEKPGIEPATPGLQGIALIHYTTAHILNTGPCHKYSIDASKTPPADKRLCFQLVNCLRQLQLNDLSS